MKAILLAIGKTDDKYIDEGMKKYIQRTTRYMPFNVKIIPNIKNSKNLNSLLIKEKEGNLIEKEIITGDFIVLLDEKGKQQNSVDFANWLNSIFLMSFKRIVFVIGGAYGFSDNIYKKADCKISLSKMTFSHQMVRLFFLEQFYRAHTILNGEPYHNS